VDFTDFIKRITGAHGDRQHALTEKKPFQFLFSSGFLSRACLGKVSFSPHEKQNGKQKRLGFRAAPGAGRSQAAACWQ
jgi:hypothetical protein